MRFLVTGCYGFLGFHICRELVARGHNVIGADRLAGARSPKGGRVAQLHNLKGFRFKATDLSQRRAVKHLLNAAKPDVVIHLAAQYAVAPLTRELLYRYIDSNYAAMPLMAFESHAQGVEHFVYASSTFVEPGQKSTHTYGASKQANEDFAEVAHAWGGMALTGMRYGSTFGPWCRPDVGIYQLARKLLRGERIEVKPRSGFHYQTAFLHVADAVGATLAAVEHPNAERAQTLTVVAPDHRHDLGQLLRMLEACLGRANCDWAGYEEKGLGGIPHAQLQQLYDATGFIPQYRVADAVIEFANWARKQHKAGLL